jgi:hypothetical protein
MYNKNTAVAVFALGKLNTILQQLTAPGYKLSEFDKRLLRGFYQTIRQQNNTNEAEKPATMGSFKFG